MKKVLVILLSVALLLTVACAQGGDSKKYAEKAEELSHELLDAGVDAEKVSSMIRRVWRNTIYEEKDYETDPYTRKDDGSFYDDFNDAIANYLRTPDYKYIVAGLEIEQPKLLRSVKEMRDGPEDCKYIYEALSEYHEVIDGIIELALGPSGNFNSYSDRYMQLQDRFVETNKSLKTEIDLILNP